MKKRLLGSLLAALFVVGLMAPAAVASVTGVAVFQGLAGVGSNFGPACSKTSGTTTGPGLLLAPASTPRTWSLDAPFTFAGTGGGGTGLSTGVFHACGWMAGTLGLNQVGGVAVGASCATTKGYGGVGEASATGASNWQVKLYNLGWKQAVGPILVVTGNYQEWAGSNGVKSSKTGTIVALVAADPFDPLTTPCVTRTADNFNINGVAALINSGPDTPKDDTILDPLGAKACNKNGDGVNDDCPTRKP